MDCQDIGERKRRRPSDGYGRAEATPSYRRLSPAMTIGRRVMRIALVGMLSVALTSGSLAYAADIAAGKEKAELCAACHGEAGISQTENIPSLAGQQDQFIQWQLVFFRSGARKNEQMQPIVEQIDNNDVRNLGAYFASLTPFKA